MLRILYPHMYVPSILDVDPLELKKRGIKALLMDLDNTIVPRDREEFSQEVVMWLKRLREHGLKLCVVSNNGTARVNKLVAPFNIPYVVRAVKPMRQAFTKGMDILGVKHSETAVVGDQIFTDILGGNRLGLFTILVVPMSGREFWATNLINRRLEKLVLKKISSRVSHEDQKYTVR
ncbi:YqeG family HAD IIIA-type phosphatase [Desulfotruncus alcoholivorax]|uniref:YqeG family HAD IIIA-type phosphatase n=1 Tax=Desulfotruncus alcoholivorax TaxID=265477 RepID=UPI0004055163|nr:YqeG family HAD IIIA-type phosphatase [Desulfotruncus alcoholivorax]